MNHMQMYKVKNKKILAIFKLISNCLAYKYGWYKILN